MKTFQILTITFILAGLSVAYLTPAPAQEVSQDEPAEFQFDDDIEFDMEMEGFEGFEDGDFGAAQPSSEEQAAAVMVATTIFILGAVFGLVSLILTGIAAYWLYDALNTVPEAHREISTVIPWLLFVPFINLVILFLVFIKVPDSLRGYLESTGNTTQGDCGKSLGLWGSVATVLGCLFPVGIVLLFMSLSKIGKAKQIIQNSMAAN